MKSPLVFRIYKNDQIHVVKQFVDDDRVIIGRGAEVHVDLDSSEISPIHCIVEKRGLQFYLCDLGSEQGTFKSRQQVLDEPINSGDSFQVGPFNIVFFVGAQKSTETIHDNKPIIKSAQQPLIKTRTAAQAEFSSSKKSHKTFAPRSEFSDLKDHLKVGSGSRVEVIVSWKERIIDTYHFGEAGKKILGVNADISVPDGSAPKDWLLLEIGNKVIIYTTSEMKMEILRDGEVNVITDSEYKLQQSEACFIQLINGMQLVIRYAPKTPAIIFDSPVILGSSELTGILAALIIAVLASLLVSVSRPKAVKEDEDIQRVAQVIFATPPPKFVQNTPIPKATDLDKKIEEDKKAKQDEEIKKALLMDQKKESKVFGDPVKPEQKAQVATSAGRAAEVKPKDSKLKAKMFTSTKQGGSVKTGEQNGANAQSKDADPNNSGLLAAFGQGGARNKLDQVYTGSGELIGAGEKAKGVSGFNSDRKGDDLGSKIKDTGAGGKGTATQGIAGIGTKGRSAGMSGYGSGTGFGDKDRVQISAGGSEEAFVGSIDREAVRRVIKSALPSFKACYEREYNQNTKLEGKVFITWEIHEQGIPKNARIIKEKSTINNSIVEECVRTRMLGLIFPEPPPGTVADISFPFVFHGQKL